MSDMSRFDMAKVLKEMKQDITDIKDWALGREQRVTKLEKPKRRAKKEEK